MESQEDSSNNDINNIINNTDNNIHNIQSSPPHNQIYDSTPDHPNATTEDKNSSNDKATEDTLGGDTGPLSNGGAVPLCPPEPLVPLHSPLPLNLSSTKPLQQANERTRKIPKLAPIAPPKGTAPTRDMLFRDLLANPVIRNGLCRPPYFIPPFHLPFLYRLQAEAGSSPSFSSSSSSSPLDLPPQVSSPAFVAGEELQMQTSLKKEEPDGRSAKPGKNSPSWLPPPLPPLPPLTSLSVPRSSVEEEEREEEEGGGGSPWCLGGEEAPHYQVKWSNHASRLSAFVAALEGDVSSSDAVLEAKDGTTFYAHRLVLAAASPFFTRTLKNVPKDQHAVIVIPRASSRSVASVLSFCYNGAVGFPSEDLKAVIELAEDLEITGLLAEKEKQRGFPPSQGVAAAPSVFTFLPPTSLSLPDFLPDRRSPSEGGFGPLFKHSRASYSPGPSSAQAWKRESETPLNYTQSLKRIKSESDATKYSSKKPSKSRKAEHSIQNFPLSSSSPVPGCLLPYSNPPSPTTHSTPGSDSGAEEPLTPATAAGVIPRQAGTGSRVILWRFLLQLLHDTRYSPYYIRWLDRAQGIFRIMESDKVAQLWGLARKNQKMTYEKMSRGMRTYYKRKILFHLDGTKLIYRFNAHDAEIQHQLRYYDLVSGGQAADDHLRASPLPYQTFANRMNADKLQNVFGSPLGRPRPELSCPPVQDTSSCPVGTTNGAPVVDHLPPMNQDIYGIRSLFPKNEPQ